MVYLAGKDEQGKTIQLEADGTRHVHYQQGQQQTQQQLAALQQVQQQQLDLLAKRPNNDYDCK